MFTCLHDDLYPSSLEVIGYWFCRVDSLTKAKVKKLRMFWGSDSQWYCKGNCHTSRDILTIYSVGCDALDLHVMRHYATTLHDKAASLQGELVGRRGSAEQRNRAYAVCKLPVFSSTWQSFQRPRVLSRSWDDNHHGVWWPLHAEPNNCAHEEPGASVAEMLQVKGFEE